MTNRKLSIYKRQDYFGQNHRHPGPRTLTPEELLGRNGDRHIQTRNVDTWARTGRDCPYLPQKKTRTEGRRHPKVVTRT